jgi:hypothetical protein
MALGLFGQAIDRLIETPAQAQARAEKEACEVDWTKCTSNAQLANNYGGWIDAKVDCKIAAEKKARYGSPTWPWPAFSSFYPGNGYITTGIAELIEPDAQFQNGFGAMVHSRVDCVYDLRSNRVTNVIIDQRTDSRGGTARREGLAGLEIGFEPVDQKT